MLPTIVHLDADAFFVACEQARDPSLRGKKCAVGGATRGIIASASYEARACGVYTPMPTTRALKVCPDLILIRGTFSLYGEVSQKMFTLCETLTPLVEQNSIDEGYFDLGACGHRTLADIEAAVRGLQRRIGEELGISVSMGIGRNKLVAQIASKLRKPKGFVVVPVGEEAAFLAPLPIGKMPGIGPKTEEALKREGIERVRDLFEQSERDLERWFGSGWRDALARARGEDDRPVESKHDDAKSYSQQETFDTDIADTAEIERVAKGMLDDLMPKVRKDGKRVKTLTVRVRYADFSHDSKGCSLEEASDLEAPFYPLIPLLLRGAWTKRRPLRLVSVKLSGVEAPAAQIEMFAAAEEKRRRLASVLDRLNQADSVVRHGHQLQPKPRQPGKPSPRHEA